MDKYQRKHLARWEQKKAKDQRKFEDYMRQHSQETVRRKIEYAVQTYTPPQDIVFSRARTLASYLKNLQIPIWWDVEDGFHLIYSRRIQLFMTEMEIAAEIAERKVEKEKQQADRLAHTLLRHYHRVNTIREELTTKTNRLRAIQNCRAIKEELMANVWHPRRVEKFLETYGWEAYDNLLGVE